MKYESLCDYYEMRRPGYRDVSMIFRMIMKRISNSEDKNTVLSPEYIYYSEKAHALKFTVADKYNGSIENGIADIFKYMNSVSVYSEENVRRLIKQTESMYREKGPYKTYEWLENAERKRKMSFVSYIVFFMVIVGLLILYYTVLQPLVFYN